MISSLIFNYLKSEFISIGGDNKVTVFYADMFNCQVGKLPMKYLGAPVTSSNLKNIDWTSWMPNSLKRRIPRFVNLR
jgi:hypothetical protein